MLLEYMVVTWEPPNRLVLDGQTALLSYEDRIDFVAEGTGTSVTDSARLDLRRIFAPGDSRDISTVVARAGEAA